MGISLIDFRISIERKINTRMKIDIKMKTPVGLLDPAKEADICLDIPATIDAKMRRDIPLEIHFSVINSPIHMTIIAPIASEKAVIITTPILPVLITAPPKR